jgi:hypothetical protein
MSMERVDDKAVVYAEDWNVDGREFVDDVGCNLAVEEHKVNASVAA